MEKRLIIIIVAPVVVGIALFLIISIVDLDLRFTPVEMSVFNYRYDVQSLSNLKENLYDTKSVDKSVDKSVTKSVDKPALENPFTNKMSVDENIGIIEPEPMLDADLIKSFDPLKKFRVSLIIIGNERKVAIINGKILKEGDIIKGFKVNKIEDQKVLLIRVDGNRELLFSDNKSYWIKVNENRE